MFKIDAKVTVFTLTFYGKFTAPGFFFNFMRFIRIINPFHATSLFLYQVKTLEILQFSDFFSGYRKRVVAQTGLTKTYFNCFLWYKAMWDLHAGFLKFCGSAEYLINVTFADTVS